MNEKRRFIARHGLSDDYLQQAIIWFDPLVDSLFSDQKKAKKTLVIGINGCQGSGKSTLADYLSISFLERGLSSIAVSIDDFYLTRQERQQLALDVHPLFLTRGVPGTHDLSLALETLHALMTYQGNVAVPRFNKAQDDRFPRSDWPEIQAPLDVIILEGWCVGISAQDDHDLRAPINPLEAEEDPDGVWRRYVNQQLASDYFKVWDLIDHLIMLQAPGFECVYQWRLEQEQKLAQGDLTASKIMRADQIKRFIQYYERLTRHGLAQLPAHCQHVFKLNPDRQITDCRSKAPGL